MTEQDRVTAKDLADRDYDRLQTELAHWMRIAGEGVQTEFQLRKEMLLLEAENARLREMLKQFLDDTYDETIWDQIRALTEPKKKAPSIGAEGS